ncbi:hypothetical protein VP01_1632g2 [Puccinia sorghi]|uniref:Uncharacterized protein n=1 Tax=Puccinia sorghi TaxID=27349 RepID=A0A0L6VIP1_9BASI|nr:hypothetical protein VP01_1632g2 [Puccinia sorghi]
MTLLSVCTMSSEAATAETRSFHLTCKYSTPPMLIVGASAEPVQDNCDTAFPPLTLSWSQGTAFFFWFWRSREVYGGSLRRWGRVMKSGLTCLIFCSPSCIPCKMFLALSTCTRGVSTLKPPIDFFFLFKHYHVFTVITYYVSPTPIIWVYRCIIWVTEVQKYVFGVGSCSQEYMLRTVVSRGLHDQATWPDRGSWHTAKFQFKPLKHSGKCFFLLSFLSYYLCLIPTCVFRFITHCHGIVGVHCLLSYLQSRIQPAVQVWRLLLAHRPSGLYSNRGFDTYVLASETKLKHHIERETTSDEKQVSEGTELGLDPDQTLRPRGDRESTRTHQKGEGGVRC